MKAHVAGLGMSLAAMLYVSTSSAALALAAPPEAAAPTTDDSEATKKQEREIIVTGVFGARAIEQAPMSINVVSADTLTQHASVSAADLLKNVPGVFVNSALGEIRNVVFSRGISANSLDGQGGYYYVSMQEDGLPVELVTGTNYGPDYFLRPDLMLSRLEGLRGGTAAITGPNAPGGIFNYISRTGRSNPGFEIQAKAGLQGNMANPYYRLDAYAGGELKPNLYYAVGGFYRWDRGSHDPGYAMNKGGQIHGNLLYEYGSGSLMLTLKYLDDHNGWNEFTPAIGATRIAPGFTSASSDLPPKNAAHCFPKTGGGTECWDPTSLVHSRSFAAGLNWKQDFGDGWHFDNKMRFTTSRADWNTGAVISAVPINDAVVSVINNTAFLPGTFNYYSRNTGRLMATLNSAGFPGSMTVTTNNLPNQNLMTNGVFTQVALVQHFKAENFVDQATLTRDIGNHHLAVGGYMGLARLRLAQGGGGIGFSTLDGSPDMLVGTYTNPAGTTYQLTDASGFTNQGSLNGNDYRGTQRQYSVFFGDSWKVLPRLTIDAGGRWESINYEVFNQTYTATTTTGGADGNALTLYDNKLATPGPVYQTRRSYRMFNYSFSAAYEVSSNFDVYVRYTNGKKAPDLGTVVAINTPAQIANVFPSPQNIQQIEMGLKYHRSGLDFQLFPFYSHLTNVTSPQTFTYLSGSRSGQFYSPPPVAGEIETYGVEMALSGRILPTLTGRMNLTLQEPKARNFGSWTQGTLGNGTDDTLTMIAAGDADNNPKIILRGGLDWEPVQGLHLFGEVNHMGKRAANAANAFYLPAYTTLDLGGSWAITPAIKVQVNVTNVTNTLGVMSWSRSGGFLASLDRQGLSKSQYNPSDLYPIVPTQPRAGFVTVNFKF